MIDLCKERYLQAFKEQAEEVIPAVLHLIWLGPKPFPLESIDTIRSWMAHNPTMKIKFWTDRKRIIPMPGMEIIFIQKEHFERLYPYYEKTNNWGEKSDLLRYEILSQEGGVYADHDAFCCHSFDELRARSTHFSCLEAPHSGMLGRHITVGIGIIGSTKRHPIIERTIENLISRYEAVSKMQAEFDHDLVLPRTYFPYTLATFQLLEEHQLNGVVYPASYFYPAKGMRPLYSEHRYGVQWFELPTHYIEYEIEKALRPTRPLFLLFLICLSICLLLLIRSSLCLFSSYVLYSPILGPPKRPLRSQKTSILSTLMKETLAKKS